MNDEELFKQMLGDDVEPIVTEKRVAVNKNRDQGVDKSERRKAAASIQASQADPLSSAPVEMVDPLALLAYRKPGVQHGVYKKMRLGKYALDARLDLHRMTVEQARKLVYQFVKDCVANDVRFALITHGKGEGRETPALLKSCIAHWLPQLDEVLAFHTAQKHHGSYGATYVMFKKSDNKKLENKELNRRKK
ncbi:DNA endonuclease SmrA [Agarilytica rhodophyticola]|uniref:DNA endonuclease SmrA n=1 Tax=Agarilytica rhodophyticola TaxID=1737490 RepID=UPI000B345BD1|nr:DNA endonuclease SmrA [Agarilytica rhodophyticola]